MKKNKKQFFLTKILCFSLFVLCALCSCKLFEDAEFNADVRGFFKEYTETAVIYQSQANSSYLTDNSGNVCYDSTSGSKTYSFILRNPQRYMLTFGYSFNDGHAAEVAASCNGTAITFNQPMYDPSSMTMTISREFLEKMDGGGNLSGSITLLEPKSYRTFDSYGMSFFANSPPPVIENAQFQLSDTNGDENTTYVICFYLPKVDEPVHSIHSTDTHRLIVNGETRYFAGGEVYTDAEHSSKDSNFVVSETVYPLSDGGYQFANSIAPLGYTPIYYKSGVHPPAGEETVTFELSVQDDAGLTSTVAISNKAKQLSEPTFSFSSLEADEDTGLATFTVNHDGTCTDDTSCGGNVLIHYVVTDNSGAIVAQSSSMNSATVSVPKGNYSVKAWASKGYYVSSEITVPTPFTVTQSPIFYVSEDGDNNNTGARGSPFRTIQCAIGKFVQGINDNEYVSTDTCKIRLKSDLTVPDNLLSSSDPLVDISCKIDLEGYGGTRTVDSSGFTKTVLHIASGAVVNINSINFTNSTGRDSSSSVIHVAGGTVAYNGGSVYGNGSSSESCGSAINVSGGSLSMTNVTVIGNYSGNSDTAGGMEIGSSGSVTLNGCTFTGNQGKGCGAIKKVGVLSISGKNTVTGNTAVNTDGTTRTSNVCLSISETTDRINISGSIAGSSIGIDSSTTPSVGNDVTFTSGYGYGTTNGLPGAVFTSDKSGSYAVTYASDSSGEAVLAVGYAAVEVGGSGGFTLNYSSSVVSGGSLAITVKDASDNDITSSVTFTSYSLTYANATVSTGYWSGSSNTVTLSGSSGNLIAGTYSLFVTFAYNGTTYDATLNFTVTAP